MVLGSGITPYQLMVDDASDEIQFNDGLDDDDTNAAPPIYVGPAVIQPPAGESGAIILQVKNADRTVMEVDNDGNLKITGRITTGNSKVDDAIYVLQQDVDKIIHSIEAKASDIINTLQKQVTGLKEEVRLLKEEEKNLKKKQARFNNLLWEEE